MKKNYAELAETLLAKVGGKENVSSVYHCATRLRFDLKDESIPNDDDIKAVPGVFGVTVAGGQYQIIIGNDVEKLYKKVVEIGGFTTQTAIEENLDGQKKGLKGYFNAFFEFMAGTMSPMIPAFTAAGFFKAVAIICGPDLLGIWEATSDLYLLFDFAYNACFYFLPIFLGYTAAKKLGINPIMGIYIGALMLAPGFVDIANTRETFTVLGIPCKLGTYGTTVFPVLLSVFAFKYVDKLFGKIIPQILSQSVKPFLEMLVMLPVTLCLFCPLGTIIGEGIAAVIIMLDNAPFITGIIGGLWPFLILTGMHMPILYAVIIPNLYSVGFDTTILPASTIINQALIGVAVAGLIRIKNKQERSNLFGMFLTLNVAAISEPLLYGFVMKHKKTLLALVAGGVCGGLFASFTNVIFYLGPNFPFIFTSLNFLQGGTMNFVLHIASALIAFGVAFAITYFYGFESNDPMLQKD